MKMAAMLSGRPFKAILNVFCLVVIMIMIVHNAAAGRSCFSMENSRSNKVTYTAGDPYVTIGVHNVGKIGLTVTNIGQIGTGYIGGMMDPLDPTSVAPSCTYPYPGGMSYLFGGSLWVGAIVGNDTLVSVGADGWIATREMWPDPYPRSCREPPGAARAPPGCAHRPA